MIAAAIITLGWVTIFERAHHFSISLSHPGQLNLLPSAGQEMSTGYSAAMLCGWGVKAGWLTSYVDRPINVLVAFRYKNSSGDKIANVNFYAVRPEATRIR